MVDIILWVCRIVLIILLYFFLFMAIKTGVNYVRNGTKKKSKGWTIHVTRGPKELKKVRIAINGPVVVGRSPGSDMVIADSFVSGRHARFMLIGEDLFIEDLNSLNGTLVNGQSLVGSTKLNKGDTVTVGEIEIKVDRQ